MNQIDFFISYSNYDEKIAKEVVAVLEKYGAKCWYAPRDDRVRCAKEVADAIKQARIFLLFLSSNAASSDYVLNELEMAYRRNQSVGSNILIEPLCIEPMNLDASKFDNIMYYLRRINFIEPKNPKSATDIAQLVLLKNEMGGKRPKKERTASNYFTNEKEAARLATQTKLTRKFDADVYQEVFNSYENPAILDVGCSNGNLILDRLSDYSGTFKLIGIDRDPHQIETANNANKNETIAFAVCDVSKKDFTDELANVMHQMNIEKFEIIHISLMLLHMKTKAALLRELRQLLKPNGTIIIKTIDDGLNYAYPDEKNVFKHIYSICEMDEAAGNRQNGREIYHDLVHAGFENIFLKKSGFSTIGLDEEEKSDFWEMYFGFIFDDMKWMLEKYPEDIDIANEYAWYAENYKDIFDDFMESDFVFSLGFQLYLAKI